MNIYLSSQTEDMLQGILESVNGRQIIDHTYTLTPYVSIAKSLIIGGYLRDEILREQLHYDLVSQDIDVLAFSDDINCLQAPISWQKLPNTVRRPIKPSKGVVRQPAMFSYGKISRYTLSHLGYYKVPGVDLLVNLLHCNLGFTSTQELLEELDFGVNQIAYDGSRLYASELFRKDINGRTLTWSGKMTSGVIRTHAEQRAHRLAKRLKFQPIWPDTQKNAA